MEGFHDLFGAVQDVDFFFCVSFSRTEEEVGGAVGFEGQFFGIGGQDAGDSGYVEAGAVVHGDPDGVFLLFDLGDPGFVGEGFQAGYGE